MIRSEVDLSVDGKSAKWIKNEWLSELASILWCLITGRDSLKWLYIIHVLCLLAAHPNTRVKKNTKSPVLRRFITPPINPLRGPSLRRPWTKRVDR